jgi:hypothetical protein
MDAILGTSRIRWGYPVQQNPDHFKISAGRSTGSYGTVFSAPGGGATRDVLCNTINYDGLGTYYVLITAVDANNNEVDGVEFTVNLVNPTDTLEAPIGVSVW